MKRYVVLDVETTGLYPAKGHRIIEIAGVAFVSDSPTEEFHSLVNVAKPVPKAVQNIHGITDQMLAGQPEADEILPTFHDFIKNSVLIAHNAEFDLSFLRYEFDRLGLKLNNRSLCTMKISRKHYHGLPNYRLETVAKRLFGIPAEEGRYHRAMDDARLTARIWLEMRKR